jgi:hypothetical protein
MNTAEKIKVMQAWAFAAHARTFRDWHNCAYRIQPKPLWWRVVTAPGKEPWLETKVGSEPPDNSPSNPSGLVIIQNWQKWTPE